MLSYDDKEEIFHDALSMIDEVVKHPDIDDSEWQLQHIKDIVDQAIRDMKGRKS